MIRLLLPTILVLGFTNMLILTTTDTQREYPHIQTYDNGVAEFTWSDGTSEIVPIQNTNCKE